MTVPASIFLEFNLPNATSWFYFSLLLAVGLFFKFSRFLSVRNWDLLTLFLLFPGLLLCQEGARQEQLARDLAKQPTAEPDRAQNAALIAGLTTTAQRARWFGYVWLFGASAYFLVRCLADLVLVRRPSLTPNLNLAGLAWLAAALFVCLVAVAVRRPETPPEPVGKVSPVQDLTQRQVQAWVQADGTDPGEVRFWVERVLACVCHLSVVVALAVIGWRHFQDLHGGIAAATCYLLLPYTAFFVGQVHHIWPVALLIWAVAAYRWPTVAGLLLGLTAGAVYPALTFPVWVSFYWRRGSGRFLAAFALTAGVSLTVVGLSLWSNGPLANSLQSAINLSDWQPWSMRASEGFWTNVHWSYRIPVFIVYVAFLGMTALWPAPKNLAHLLALSAALLIGCQFWYADKGGVYVLWYLPLLLLLMFRPNLADRQAPTIHPENDWLHWTGRRLARLGHRLFRFPEPAHAV
jgi:hypothetical protein